jgi:superoxide dismutase, Cu-Zn family
MRVQNILQLFVVAAGVNACAGVDSDIPDSDNPEEAAFGEVQSAIHGNSKQRTAHLVDAAGNPIGTYKFKDIDRNPNTPGLRVEAKVEGLTPGFHGTHLHANNNPANGDGCIPPFTSADGHLNPSGNVHGDHAGDMPVLMAGDDGTALLVFTTDRVTLAEIDGAAVIVHALPDNFHNIPLGPNADQYTANSTAATDLTDATGNAGARVGCGVIE